MIIIKFIGASVISFSLVTSIGLAFNPAAVKEKNIIVKENETAVIQKNKIITHDEIDVLQKYLIEYNVCTGLNKLLARQRSVDELIDCVEYAVRMSNPERS